MTYIPEFPPVTRYTRPVRSGKLLGVQVMISQEAVECELTIQRFIEERKYRTTSRLPFKTLQGRVGVSKMKW